MAAGLYDITNEILGKGHFAIVKLAKHCLTGEHVAIKIIDKAKQLSKEGLDQLSNEIRLWSILSEHEHPNVIKLYQCIDTRTKLYLVMEYFGGKVDELDEHIQKKNDGNGLDEQDAKHIFRQVCNAILYCHSLKIVHRDLKPENILLIYNPSINVLQGNSSNNIYPVVKLIDFGLSNQWVDNELLRTSCGSLAYSAPEILLGNQYYGPTVDIWALGCILYIMLYGCNPFMQLNDSETLTRILDCSFSIPEKSSVNEMSINLIKGILKKEPDKRLTIEEITNHPWLESEETNFSKSVNHSVTTGHVHEHIIDQMIDQGIALPKDIIKKILRNEQHSESNSLNEEMTTKSHVNDQHYIKATYHLLKDKSIRECKGLEQNSNCNYIKRGNIRKKPNYSNRKRLNSSLDKGENTSARGNARLTKPNLSSLEVPNNSNTFALPLARKCSIVSEEGSVCNESSLPETVTAEKNSDQENTRPIVNIFVTDSSEYSSDNAHQIIPESISDFSLNLNDTNKYIHSDKLKHEATSLHPVSSSPDFLNSEMMSNDDQNVDFSTFDPNICDLRPMDFNSRDSFDITEFTKDSLLTRYRDFSKMKSKKLNNVRVAKSSTNRASLSNSYQSNNKSPSMRVIIQSKSLNNIALSEQPETKLATSMSAVSIKPSKSDKTDCCAIC